MHKHLACKNELTNEMIRSYIVKKDEIVDRVQMETRIQILLVALLQLPPVHFLVLSKMKKKKHDL